jgi:hypothetical protein
MPSLTKYLTNYSIGYNELKDIIIRIMPSDNKYYDFIWSKHGAHVFYALLLSMNQYLIQRGIRIGYATQAKYMRWLKEQIRDSRISCPEPIINYLKQLVSDSTNVSTETAINALSHNMSVRSSLDFIPAFFSKYNSFDTVSLQDIARLDFETINIEEIERRVQKTRIPYKMRRYEKILWVNSIKDDPVSIRISFDRVYFNHTRKLIHDKDGEYNNFDVYTSDSQSEAIIEHVINLINNQPACSSLLKEDWRMSGLYGANSFMAIGGDAFLADFIKHQRLI